VCRFDYLPQASESMVPSFGMDGTEKGGGVTEGISYLVGRNFFFFQTPSITGKPYKRFVFSFRVLHEVHQCQRWSARTDSSQAPKSFADDSIDAGGLACTIGHQEGEERLCPPKGRTGTLRRCGRVGRRFTTGYRSMNHVPSKKFLS
jgi:hypothetical protein